MVAKPDLITSSGRYTMSKRLSLLIAVATFATTLAIPMAYSASQTYTGIISDSMCGSKHMMPGKSAAECTQECVKAGASYILVSGNKSYSLSAKPQTLAPFAGKQVVIEGNLTANKIAVTMIHEAN